MGRLFPKRFSFFMKGEITMSKSITPGQKKQYLRFIEDTAEKALAEAGIDRDGIQKLIGNGGEFQADVLASIRRLSVSNQFAGEEVSSNYVYPSGYAVRGITEQTNRLREHIPGIRTANEKLAGQPLPTGAEFWAAIPRWEKLAPTYNEAVEEVLTLIAKSRKFHNYRTGQLGPGRLRQHVRTVKMIETLGNQQKDHDILIVPAQFGLRHRGRSVRRAREVFAADEFGLGAYEVGIMLLTHPDRLIHGDNLWINCAGDEYHDPDGDAPFCYAPYFFFLGGGLGFYDLWFGHARVRFGSASGFLPQ